MATQPKAINYANNSEVTAASTAAKLFPDTAAFRASTLALTAKPVQRYRGEIPSIPHICVCCHQRISIISSGESFSWSSVLLFFCFFWGFFYRVVHRGISWRSLSLPLPGQLMLSSDRGHRGTIPVTFPHSRRARLMRHMCSARAAVLFYSKSYQRMKERPAQRGVS